MKEPPGKPSAIYILSPYKSTILTWFALLVCAPKCSLQMGEGLPNMTAFNL
jgi:hypothetical protein